MDDFFQYLIYAVIIISFLSSLFKKKPPPQQPQRRVPQDASPPAYQNKTEEVDILAEIQNMFKTEAEKQQQTLPQPQEKETKIAGTVKRKERDFSEEKFITSEHAPEPVQPELKKSKPVIDSKIEAEAKSLEEYLIRRSTVHEEAARNLIRKLKDPKTFREFILVSEILSRPKALRR